MTINTGRHIHDANICMNEHTTRLLSHVEFSPGQLRKVGAGATIFSEISQIRIFWAQEA